MPLLSKSKISSLYPSSVTVQPGLCRTWLETQVVGFVNGSNVILLIKVPNEYFLYSLYEPVCEKTNNLGLTRSDTNQAVQS